MSDTCFRGTAPRSAPVSQTRLHDPDFRRARGWWSQLRDRLTLERLSRDEMLNDHLLEDIGLSRADLTALTL